MKRLVLAGCALGTAVAVLCLSRAVDADHRVSVKVRPLHTKSCVTALEGAFKGKASVKAEVNQSEGLVSVSVPHEGPVKVLELVEAIRSRGYEPLGLVLSVGLDAKVTLRSGGFGVRESQTALTEALSELGFLDTNSIKFAGTSAAVPVAGTGEQVDIDVLALMGAASRAGFALSGIEVQGSPGKTVVTATASGGLKQPDKKICIVKGSASKVFTKYKGIDVPFCCKNCQARFEGLSDADKDFNIRDAVDRFGEDRAVARAKAEAKSALKAETSTPATPAKAMALPTQAQLGNNCVILRGEPGKRNLTRQFRGLNVPLCCRSCQSEWDSLSDEDKVRTLAEIAAAK